MSGELWGDDATRFLPEPSRVNVEGTALPGGTAVSGSEDMIEILVGERDRALREVMTLEREREALLVHIREQHQKVLRLTECLNVACRERDEARAEAARLRENLEWSEACRKARLSMAETCLNGRAEGKSPCGACSICCGDLKDEVARLRRGIEAYRMAHECDDLDSEWPAVAGCASCAWERSEGKAMEVSGDEQC